MSEMDSYIVPLLGGGRPGVGVGGGGVKWGLEGADTQHQLLKVTFRWPYLWLLGGEGELGAWLELAETAETRAGVWRRSNNGKPCNRERKDC